MDAIDYFIMEKLKAIAEKLPSSIHEDPASFACGYNTGYKSAILDLIKCKENHEKESLR